MGRLSHIFSKLPTTPEFLMHEFFSRARNLSSAFVCLHAQIARCLRTFYLHVLVISRWSKPAGSAVGRSQLATHPCFHKWFVKMKSVVTSHSVRWSRCCSWQWNKGVPAVPMTSHRCGKSVSTQLSLELSVPSPPQQPYSSPAHGRTNPYLIYSLSLWTCKKSCLIPVSKSVHESSVSYQPWNQFKHSFVWGLEN